MEHGKNYFRDVIGFSLLFNAFCSASIVVCFRFTFLTSHVRTKKIFNPKNVLSHCIFLSFLLRSKHIRNPKLISSFKSRCCKSLKLAHKYFRTHKTFNVHYIFSTIRTYHYIFEWNYIFCVKEVNGNHKVVGKIKFPNSYDIIVIG